MPSKAAAQAAAAQEAKKHQKLAKSKKTLPSFDEVAKHASAKVRSMEADSTLFDKNMLDVIPKFELNELSLGRVLGKGGFGTVTEVSKINCSDYTAKNEGPAADDDDDQAKQDRQFIAQYAIRDGGDARYCIKALSPSVVADPNLIVQGTIDMAVETMFLSVISHPHIITMRAFGAKGFLEKDYFIVLDRLYDTLEARIPQWKKQGKKSRSLVNKMKKKTRTIQEELMAVKLSYAYDLVGALEYLHKKKLVYRDLKPENVGFNVRDDIVLFDFGLAREIHDKDKVSSTTWKLTGETGSLRYMAPEVCLSKPYGYSADVYSFGIMMWEMLSSDSKPFAGYNKEMHSDLVVDKGGRPIVEESWGPSIKGFLNSSWNKDLNRRPDSAKASAILKREVSKLTGGSDLELNNFRRKSTFVNRDSRREKASITKQTTSGLLAIEELSEDESEHSELGATVMH